MLAARRHLLRTIALAAAACVATAAGPGGGGGAKVNGQYTLNFYGAYHGTGRANVSASMLHVITATLTNDAGQTLTLKNLHAPRDGYYFAGNTTAGGLTFTLSGGRIDPADAQLPNTRVAATLSDGAGGFGRMIGTHD